MSVTLVVIPSSLGSQAVLGLIKTLIASTSIGVGGAIASSKNTNKQSANESFYSYDNVVAGEMNKQYRKQYNTVCSQYKTVFKDENLLIKTLNEHGVSNIEKNDNKIYCSLDELKFEFDKNSEGIYIMNITHKENETMEIVDELGEEYQVNVQEQSYMNLKKNLENQNLKIDSEEVLEDNSIMITVNLD